MEPAMLTAIVALIAAVFGIAFNYMKLQNERDQWRKALESQQSQWQKDRAADLRSRFLHDEVIERYKTYPAVMKILGAVRDIPDPDKKHWQSLEKNPEQLLNYCR